MMATHCLDCGKHLTSRNAYRDWRNRTGLASYCKHCIRWRFRIKYYLRRIQERQKKPPSNRKEQ
jgi:hypothetical protein